MLPTFRTNAFQPDNLFCISLCKSITSHFIAATTTTKEFGNFFYFQSIPPWMKRKNFWKKLGGLMICSAIIHLNFIHERFGYQAKRCSAIFLKWGQDKWWAIKAINISHFKNPINHMSALQMIVMSVKSICSTNQMKKKAKCGRHQLTNMQRM